MEGGWATSPTSWQPSDWDVFLRRLGIMSDRAALREIERGGEHSGKIRGWIMIHHRTKFVPLRLIEAVGLELGGEI